MGNRGTYPTPHINDSPIKALKLLVRHKPSHYTLSVACPLIKAGYIIAYHGGCRPDQRQDKRSSAHFVAKRTDEQQAYGVTSLRKCRDIGRGLKADIEVVGQNIENLSRISAIML
jgi:hypothetical protein